jgi:hypothetical protein
MYQITNQLIPLNEDFAIEVYPSIYSRCFNRINQCRNFFGYAYGFINRNLRIFYFFLKIYNFVMRLLNSVWFYFVISLSVVFSYYICHLFFKFIVKLAVEFLSILKKIYRFSFKKSNSSINVENRIEVSLPENIGNNNPSKIN